MWWLPLILLATVLYHLIQRQYSYWQHLGFPYAPPSIPFGNLKPVQRKERSFGLVMWDLYNTHKEKLLGIYLFFKPAILLRDAETVRQIMTTDFPSFHDRGVFVDEKNDPLSANLFALRGQSWKSLRAKLTPSFSSGKLKGMFGTIDDVSSKLICELNKQLEGKENAEFEIKSVLTTYAVDIIASVIFGLDVDSFAKPENEFRVLTERLRHGGNILQKLRVLVGFICPPIASVLARFGVRDPITPTLRDMMQHTIEFREQHKVVRKDLLQLLIQLRNTGKISEDDDKNWDIETAAENLKSMSIELIAAQSFVFYIAGSDTTATTASFTLYELAMYPDLLKRAEVEVAQCYKKHGLQPRDSLTYDALQDMQFLDLCIKETIRKYPGLPFLNRECTQDYQVPGTSYTIPKGTGIIISLIGMHRDPEYFPEPMKYDPDRFDPEIMRYNPTAYMPFGVGPRHCIAERMGRLNAKVAVAKILANFNIEPVTHEEVQFQFHTAPVLIPSKPLNIRLSKKGTKTSA